MLCHGTVCVVGKIRDLILQLSKSSIYSTKPLLSITTGAIPALLTGVMVACLPEKIGSQKRYRCLAGGIGGVVITEIYCAVIVHIKGMASSELFENILSGDSLVVRIIPALLAGVVMSRIITRLPGLDISCPETDSLS
ncbi:hypothetical protein [Escherichia coli]|uniref:hypothetical protein n=1 Tax=Escherichia coli TaxID=562 RepID=UPI002024F683|nr:hypothetical protein [Escherichia coli]